MPEPPGPDGIVRPNVRAYDYDGVDRPYPTQPDSAGPIPAMPTPSDATASVHPLGADPIDARIEDARLRAARVAASLPTFGSHGPTPQPHELVPPPRDPDNPFGDFFGDGPSAWLEDDDDRDDDVHQGSLAGLFLATAAIALTLAAWAVWGVALYRGAGGAEAGGFVLLGLLLWIRYLSLPAEQQHGWMIRRHERFRSFIDRRTSPLRVRTEGQLSMRRERDRYRAMRDERARRIAALGESAYRASRHGQVPIHLQSGVERVAAIERLMLTQDQRIHQIEAARSSRVADSAASQQSE